MGSELKSGQFLFDRRSDSYIRYWIHHLVVCLTTALNNKPLISSCTVIPSRIRLNLAKGKHLVPRWCRSLVRICPEPCQYPVSEYSHSLNSHSKPLLQFLLCCFWLYQQHAVSVALSLWPRVQRDEQISPHLRQLCGKESLGSVKYIQSDHPDTGSRNSPVTKENVNSWQFLTVSWDRKSVV